MRLNNNRPPDVTAVKITDERLTFDLEDGRTVSVPLSVMRDVSPWDGFLYSTIRLSNQWQTFTIPVTASFAIQDSGRVSLDVEYAPASVYVRNMSLVQSGQRGLATGESIESANISLLGPGEGATPARLSDYASFIIATDRNYVNALRDTLREATDSLVPITGITLPFVSAGGSSLSISLAAAGILLSISRETVERGTWNDASADRGRRHGRAHLPGPGRRSLAPKP